MTFGVLHNSNSLISLFSQISQISPEGEKMTTQEDVTEESASESENISEGDADDEDAGKESS